jgi:hypothetical protein
MDNDGVNDILSGSPASPTIAQFNTFTMYRLFDRISATVTLTYSVTARIITGFSLVPIPIQREATIMGLQSKQLSRLRRIS